MNGTRPPFAPRLVPIALAAAFSLAVPPDGQLAAENASRAMFPSPREIAGPAWAPVPPSPFLRLPLLPPSSNRTRSRAEARPVQPSSLPAGANTSAIRTAPCPDDALAMGVPVVCGYVPVPVDWEDPWEPGTIPIYFELYVPDRPAPAASAMLMNWGGPGGGTTPYRFYAFYFFGSNLDTQDLLLIDDRGRGLSGTIECEALQHGTKLFAEAEVECAAQLAAGACHYGTGDIAQDTDAVRAALGYDKVDYFGWSYGGADVEAYATRFGDHLRSIVLDSPVGSPAMRGFDFSWSRIASESRMVRLDCLRSPTCSLDHPVPEVELDALTWTLRNSPVEGDAYNASGTPVHVRIDEGAFLGYLLDNPTGKFLTTGEILAAGQALWSGDPAPLLRLGAEGYFPVESFDSGDPTYFSYGAMLATWSADFEFPWRWASPPKTRLKQFETAVNALPRTAFSPFSKEAATGNLLFDFVLPELWWEIPMPPAPLVPRGASYPLVPTLVLSGDMDRRVPLEVTGRVATLYPQASFFEVPEAGHVAVMWSKCAANLASGFLRTLAVGDVTCLAAPETVWPAVGRFPLFARDAVAADEDSGNAVGLDERRVATVAVAAATDAMQRVLIGSGDGVGLRGGTFHAEFGDMNPLTVTLDQCAFSSDVTVSGTVTWSPGAPAVLGAGGDFSFKADLTVGGDGTEGGTIHVEGTWMAPGPVGRFRVTGTLGGEALALLVPQA